MPSITDPEVRAFLTEGTRTGKLSYLAASGRPLVAPVWFIVEDDTMVFNTGQDTAKGRYLARDPRVSLCVDLEVPPFAFVQVQGDAELSEDPGELVRTATLIGARYMGPDRAQEFGRRNARARRAGGAGPAGQGPGRVRRKRLTRLRRTRHLTAPHALPDGTTGRAPGGVATRTMKKLLELLVCILHPVAVILIWVDLATRRNLSGLAKVAWAVFALIPLVPFLYVLTGGDLW